MASHGKAKRRPQVLAFFQCQISLLAGIFTLFFGQLIEAKKQEASNNSLDEGKKQLYTQRQLAEL